LNSDFQHEFTISTLKLFIRKRARQAEFQFDVLSATPKRHYALAPVVDPQQELFFVSYAEQVKPLLGFR